MAQITFRGCPYVDVEAAQVLPHQVVPGPRKPKLVPAIRTEDGVKVMVTPQTLKSQPQRYKPRRGPVPASPAGQRVSPSTSEPRPAPDDEIAEHPDLPHAGLTQAMAAKRVPYQRSATEANEGVAATQLPVEAQTAVRDQLRHLLGYLNLHPHGVKRGANIYQLQENNNEAYGTYDFNTGAVHINEDVHHRAMAFLQDPTNPKHQRYAEDVSTLIHETLHSHAPLHPKAYSGQAAFIEEATTEMLARRVMREQFGIPDERWCDKEGAPSGSYGDDIHHLNQLVSQTLGQYTPLAHQHVYRMIEDAAAKMRQRQPHNFGRRNHYVRHFLSQLTLPPQVFVGLDAAAAAKRQEQIVDTLTNEIENRYHRWA